MTTMTPRVNAIACCAAVCSMTLTMALCGCGDNEDYLDGYEPIQQVPPRAETDEHPPAPAPREDAAEAANASSNDPNVATFLGLRGPKPESWTDQPPPNPMVDTNFVVPAPEGSQPANINVFYFGQGTGGPVEDNIQRWAGQFRTPDGGEVEPDVDSFEVDGMPVTLVELAGEYQGMSDPQARQDQLMLSAIIDAPAGRLFIRLVGDAATIEHNREDYMTFIRGLRRVDGE